MVLLMELMPSSCGPSLFYVVQVGHKFDCSSDSTSAIASFLTSELATRVAKLKDALQNYLQVFLLPGVGHCVGWSARA